MLALLLNSFLILLWIGWATQAVVSVIQVRKYGRLLQRPRREKYMAYRPRAAVIVPFKGVEAALANNIRSLCQQHYPEYRLVFVVESADDPAYPVLKKAVAADTGRTIDLLIADRADPTVGQKVHNQLVALAHLERVGSEHEVLVFADSDAVPGPEWLDDLVGPLVKPEVGVTTGYRWLVPEADASDPVGKPTIWAKLASVMNSSVACFAVIPMFHLAWGGSMALRVDTAREGDLVGSLRGCITDDYPLSQLSKRVGKRVYFVPRCLIASPVNFSRDELINFAHRQYLITRVYAPWLYVGAVTLPLLYILSFVTAWAAVAAGLLNVEWLQPETWWAAVGAIVTVTVANHIRATYRKRVVRYAFGQAMADRLRSTLRLDRWATVVWMTLHWLLIIRAGVGRTMRWRGIAYEIRGPQNVRRLA
ncbi:glycosyltransferase [Phycisphaerales bacterium AB-hyl4]|uniref:Glycosyltransferase n=1 Tax=Natronomicrosphaera hydrolytica TaxID=3242702 RepID=A0ABV4U308_9BACT